MSETKGNIMYAALRLFARNGYEATSVSDIAGEMGMTKGALYKHYKNKQDIFDHIVEHLFETDREQAKEHGMPEETKEIAPQAFGGTSIEQMMSFVEDQFRFLTEDEFTSGVRKMLTLEQYRNPEMSKLYKNWLVTGPVSYLEDLFREMIEQDLWRSSDPEALAIELYAPVYLFMSISDAAETEGREDAIEKAVKVSGNITKAAGPSKNKIEAAEMLSKHIENFIEKNTAK